MTDYLSEILKFVTKVDRLNRSEIDFHCASLDDLSDLRNAIGKYIGPADVTMSKIGLFVRVRLYNLNYANEIYDKCKACIKDRFLGLESTEYNLPVSDGCSITPFQNTRFESNGFLAVYRPLRYMVNTHGEIHTIRFSPGMFEWEPKPAETVVSDQPAAPEPPSYVSPLKSVIVITNVGIEIAINHEATTREIRRLIKFAEKLTETHANIRAIAIGYSKISLGACETWEILNNVAGIIRLAFPVGRWPQ